MELGDDHQLYEVYQPSSQKYQNLSTLCECLLTSHLIYCHDNTSHIYTSIKINRAQWKLAITTNVDFNTTKTFFKSCISQNSRHLPLLLYKTSRKNNQKHLKLILQPVRFHENVLCLKVFLIYSFIFF